MMFGVHKHIWRAKKMTKIIPHLWFDTEAKEATEFYMGLFEESKLTGTQLLEDTPGGDTQVYNFALYGQSFTAINGGPYFTFNPSISLTVKCETKEELDEKWAYLIEEGKALMPLQEYTFSEWYGWVEDKYGLTWQLILAEEEFEQKIIPSLMFSGDKTGKAKEAMRYYTNLFQDGEIVEEHVYERDAAKNSKAQISHAVFELMDVEFIAMDDGDSADAPFNEAFSLMVHCVTQAEIDYYWEKLSADPEAEECGWLKDKYGLSWQIVRSSLDEYLETGTREQVNRVTKAFLKMKKLDIGALERAWLDID